MKRIRKNNFGSSSEYLIQKYYGKYCGIFDQISIFKNLGMWKEQFNLVAPVIPGYAAELYGENFRVDYHLGGFSLLAENSFIRAEGEAIERYSHIMAEAKLRKQIICSSYLELKATGKKVCPLKYINVYSDEQLSNIRLPNFTRKYIDEKDNIEWICCKSIYNNEPVYIPAQMFFLMSSNQTEKRYFMSVSTGTAAHKTMEKALENALMEYLQLDSMMLSWYVYGKMQRISRVGETIQKLLDDIRYLKEYEVIFIDMSLDKPVYVIGCFIRNKLKKYPYFAFGMQADIDLEKAMYRSFMEGYANICPRLATRSEGEKINFSQLLDKMKKNQIYNLNDNTDFYLSENGIDIIDKWLEKILTDEKGKKTTKKYAHKNVLNEIIYYLSGISEYACYFDITSEEYKEDNWFVIRTIIPELLPLCMPSLPYENHPRVLENGGVKNRCIHPCP